MILRPGSDQPAAVLFVYAGFNGVDTIFDDIQYCAIQTGSDKGKKSAATQIFRDTCHVYVLMMSDSLPYSRA